MDYFRDGIRLREVVANPNAPFRSLLALVRSRVAAQGDKAVLWSVKFGPDFGDGVEVPVSLSSDQEPATSGE
jgi:hypothetical protein